MKIATVILRCEDKQHEFSFVVDGDTQESIAEGMKILLKEVLDI